MENASKALIMAGAVLIGIMILGSAIYLFNSFSDTTSNVVSVFEQKRISEFNAQFMKYENKTLRCT